ncbi:MAG TPA: MFS transporter [Acidimicrobiia bacterium]|nr:MFS transporter [Acidimicrobiia bacterium]
MKSRIHGFTDATFRSLHVPNFRKFFFGQLISQVGNWLTLIAQTLLVLHLTNKSGVAVGVLSACQFAPVLVLGAWAGLVADRSDKRKLLVVVQFIAMAQSFVLAALAFSGHPPVWSIDLVAVVGGCTVAFDNPARRAFVVEMVEGEDVSNAVSLNSALMTSARIIGPAFAGLLVIVAGYGWCFTLDALSYIAVIVAFLKMNPAELRMPPVTERARKQIRAGLSYVRTVPDLWIPLLMMAVVGTLSFNFQVVLSLFVEKTFHGGTGMFTLLFSTTAVGSLMGALSTARRKTIETRDVIVAALAFGIAMFVLAASPDLAIAFPLGIALGWTSISFMTASTAIVNLRSAPEMRGRVLALQAIVFLGSTPIGGPLLGVICDVYGARAGLVVGGVAALGAALFGILVVRRHARRVASVTPELNRVDAAQASYAR